MSARHGRYRQAGRGAGACSDDHWWLNADKMTCLGALIAFVWAYLRCTGGVFSFFGLVDTVFVWLVAGPLGALCGYVLWCGLAVAHECHLVDFYDKIVDGVLAVLGILIVWGGKGILWLLCGLWKLSVAAWRTFKNRHAHGNGAATASQSGGISASGGESAPVIDAEFHSVEEEGDDPHYGCIVQHKTWEESRSYDA